MTYALTPHDWTLRYKDGFISMQEKAEDEILPIKVMEIGSDDFLGKYPREENGWQEGWFKFNDERLILDKPRLGAINLESGMVFYIRPVLSRQYADSLKTDYVNVFDPLIKLREKVSDSSGKKIASEYTTLDNKSLLNSIFNNRLLYPEDALSSILSGERIASAFNEDWFFCISNQGNDIILYRKERAVGWMEGGSVIIPNRLDFLSDELSLLGIKVEIDEIMEQV